MTFITKDKIRELIENAPEGTDGKQIVQGLRDRGHELEGFRSQQELSISTPSPETRTSTPAVDPTASMPGMGLVQAVAEAPAQVAALGASLGRAGFKGAEAVGRFAIGDAEGAMQAVIKAGEPVEIPIFGGVKPPDDFLEAMGIGLELSSYFIGGSGVKTIWNLKTAIWKGLQQGLKWGAVDGLLDSIGRVLQKEENKASLASVLEVGLGTGIGTVTGGVVGGGTPAIKSLWKYLKQGGKQFTAEVVEEIVEETGERIAKVRVEEVPLKKQAKNVQEAIQAGIDAPQANLMTNMSDADKALARKMYELAELSENTLKITRRPIAEVGEITLKRVKHLQSVNSKTGRQLGELVEQMPTDPIDITEISTNYINDLRQAGVKTRDGVLDFTDTRWAGSKSATIRNNLQMLYDDLVPQKTGGITEEFVESQPQKVYHTTNATNKDIILEQGFKKGNELPEDAFRGGGYGELQDSISFADNVKDAKRFGISQNNTLIEAELKPNLKIIDRLDIEYAEELNNEISQLLKDKVDAVRIGSGEGEIVVINPDAIGKITDTFDFKGVEAKDLDKLFQSKTNTKTKQAVKGTGEIAEGLTPQKIHTLRQRLFDDLKLGKQAKEVLGYGEKLMSDMRKTLNEPLNNISDQYKTLNLTYAQTAGALQQFHKKIGLEWDGNSINEMLDLRAGEVMNRVLGNNQATYLAMFEELERSAVQTGFKAENSVLDQLLFADFLEDLFGTSQTRSLRGQVGRAGVDVTQAITNPKAKALEMGVNAFNRLRGQTPEAQKEAVKNLIGF